MHASVGGGGGGLFRGAPPPPPGMNNVVIAAAPALCENAPKDTPRAEVLHTAAIFSMDVLALPVMSRGWRNATV